jgi:hypothetical protein
MSPTRFVLAVGALVCIVLAAANLFFWHALYWIPIGWYAVVVLFLAVFEVVRYRPSVNRNSPTWRATGERFLDPVTGEPTTVYYDPATGKRDYRPASDPSARGGTGI